MYEVIIQGIGILGAIFAFITFQNNNHKTMMIMKTLSELAFVVQFAFLHAVSGFVMNICGCIRNLTFAYLVKKDKKINVFIAFFVIIDIVVGALTWINVLSLLAICGDIIITIACSMKNPIKVRYLSIPGSICWLCYDVIYFTLGGIVTEIFSIISIIIAIVLKRNNSLSKKEEMS